MDKCSQYIAMCDEDPQYFHAEDCERAIADRLSDLNHGREKDTVTVKDGLFGLIGRKTKQRAIYKPFGYLRGCAMVANQCSAMIPYTGLYAACKSGDYSRLQQAFYQYARIKALFSSIMDGGEDHSTLFRCAIWGMAAADCELLETLLPQEAGISTTGHPLNVIGTNLLMGLWYRNKTHLKMAKEEAVVWLESKHTMTHSGTVRFLLALAEKDAAQAGMALQEICKGIPREKDLFVQSAVKRYSEYMVPFLHGLYSLAFFVGGREFYVKLPMPGQYVWTPYADYLSVQENPSPAAEPCFAFSGEAQIINLMIDKIPPVKIISDVNDQLIDTKTMNDELLSNLSTSINVEDFFRQYN